MKKIFNNCAVVAFMLLAAVSCDNKTNDLLPEADVVSEDFLQFRTESDYDSALVNPKLSLNAPAGFVSLANTLAAPNARTEAKEEKIPEELARLLNKDGVMQVGNWVIKLNFKDKLVHVIGNDQKKKLYTKLLKEQKDKDIYVFSFDDEVFALLDEGITVSPTLSPAKNGRVSAGILCFGGIGGGDLTRWYSSTCTFGTFPTPNTSRFTLGTEYGKYGVYYRLWAKIESLTADYFVNGVLSNSLCLTKGTFTPDIYWRSNCRNYNEGTWNPGQIPYDLEYAGSPGYNNYIQRWTLYASGRGLRCIRINDFTLNNQSMTWYYLENCNI